MKRFTYIYLETNEGLNTNYAKIKKSYIATNVGVNNNYVKIKTLFSDKKCSKF